MVFTVRPISCRSGAVRTCTSIFRSYPINNAKVVTDAKNGTIYLSSVVVEPRKPEPPSEKYNEVYANKGGLFQIIRIDNNTLDFISKRFDGMIIDQFSLKK
jgi:hypothetical protein